jgi:hypothetical protein
MSATGSPVHRGEGFPDAGLAGRANNGGAFETDERERLCDYIDESLTGHGVDGT